MATWKKVIVSGSNAVLNQLNVGGNQQIGTTQGTTYLTGSFTGSFTGDGSGLTGVVATAGFPLSQSTGIVPFSYNGSATVTVAVSGASSLNTNAITKWNGAAFANSSLTDNGTVISGSTSIVLTGANSSLTGSFSGSFKGDGSGLTGLITDLEFSGSTGGGVVDLLTQVLTITGTANEIETSASGQTLTIGLPNDVTLGGDLTLGGNDIKASDGNTNITLTSNTLTTFAGDIKVMGNDIQSSGGQSVFTLNGTNATANGNLTVSGDLTVAGTASFQNQTSLIIADRFALLASGSSTLTDGGIIVAAGGIGNDISGSAFFLESTSTSTYGRFAVAPLVHSSASSVTADEYAVTAKLSAAAAPSDAVPPTWGGSTNGAGNIWIKQDTGDIYIWA